MPFYKGVEKQGKLKWFVTIFVHFSLPFFFGPLTLWSAYQLAKLQRGSGYFKCTWSSEIHTRGYKIQWSECDENASFTNSIDVASPALQYFSDLRIWTQCTTFFLYVYGQFMPYHSSALCFYIIMSKLVCSRQNPCQNLIHARNCKHRFFSKLYEHTLCEFVASTPLHATQCLTVRFVASSMFRIVHNFFAGAKWRRWR